MASSESLSANLKLVESKKNSIRNTILQLAIEWKDLDEHLDSTDKRFYECVGELESREKNLESIRESVMESNNDLDLIRKSIESHAEELESKEKKFQSFQQAQIEELKLKEKQLDAIQRCSEERFKEVELREKKLSELWKSAEGLWEKLQVEMKEFEPIQKSISGRIKKINSKEKHFEDRAKEIDAIQNWIERRAKELDTKEEQFEGCSKNLELKAQQLQSVEKLNEERCKELELKEQEVDSAQKYNSQCFKDYHTKKKQLQSDQLLFEERSKKFELNKKQLGERLKEIELKEKQLEERSKEIELNEKKLDSTRILLEKQSRKVNYVPGLINSIPGLGLIDQSLMEILEIQAKEKELHSAEQSIQQRLRALESKERQVEECIKELETKETQFHSTQKSVQEGHTGLESGEMQCKECVKELEMKEKLCGDAVHSKPSVKQDQFSGDNDLKHYVAEELQLLGCVDGKSLQIFLNERVNHHKSMRSSVYLALRLSSSDPAKLVLEAMEGFYPPHTKIGDMEFEASIVRKSCSLLLEQAMRVSPRIGHCVKEEAVKLAVDWKSKMEVEGKKSLEVWCFLLLVGTFRLVSSFNSEEVFKLFETIANQQDAPELCRALCFADKVPDLVQDLIKRRQILAAIRFIHAFKLVDMFPPVPILEDYFKFWKKIADNSCKMENLTRGQIVMAKKSIAALKDVLKCMEDHKLEIEYLPEELEECIYVVTEKANSSSAPANPDSHPQLQNKKNYGATVASALKVTRHQHIRNKRPRRAVSEDAQNASTGAASTTRSIHLPYRDSGNPKFRWKKKNYGAAAHKVRWKQQDRNKRPRRDVSEDAPISSIGNASAIHSLHSPLQHPASRFDDQGASYFVPSRGDYDFAGFPPDAHASSHPDKSTPLFARDAPSEDYYYDGPFSLEGTTDSSHQPLPSGRHRDTGREPCFYNDPVPLDGCDLPLPSSSRRNELRQPCFLDVRAPFYGYEVPMPFGSSRDALLEPCFYDGFDVPSPFRPKFLGDH